MIVLKYKKQFMWQLMIDDLDLSLICVTGDGVLTPELGWPFQPPSKDVVPGERYVSLPWSAFFKKSSWHLPK
jgi:hypothetical protein